MESGIDRVSLGVQSFVDAEIRRTGRKHTAARVAEEIATLRAAGIRAVNIDLIAGLAAQTEAGWRASLDWIERLAPEHVSVYMLEIDDDSRLGKEMLLGGVRYGASDAPDEDATAAFYEMAVERLAQLGIPRYEISNFARPGAESRHNLKYWTLAPYVGFGADAHSFDGRARWQNPETVEEYLNQPYPCPAPGPRPPAPEDERMFLGLRLAAGIRPTPAEWQALCRAHPQVHRIRPARIRGRRPPAHQPRRDAFQRSLPGVSRLMIDLRSDTVTRPTPAMRRRAAGRRRNRAASEYRGEDPAVGNRLERRAAEIAGGKPR